MAYSWCTIVSPPSINANTRSKDNCKCGYVRCSVCACEYAACRTFLVSSTHEPTASLS